MAFSGVASTKGPGSFQSVAFLVQDPFSSHASIHSGSPDYFRPAEVLRKKTVSGSSGRSGTQLQGREPQTEILCALTPFDTLKGFRKTHEILALLTECPFLRWRRNPPASKKQTPQGVAGFFSTLLALAAQDRKRPFPS